MSAAKAPERKSLRFDECFPKWKPHKEERRALDAERREAAVIGKRELRRPRR